MKAAALPCPRSTTARRPSGWALPVLVALALPLLLTALPTEVSAQEGEAAFMTAKQVEYYRKGLQAYKDEDFDRAIEYYELALKEGEWNILYLGAGRAYSRKGRCKEADARFAKALEARPVPSPPPADIKSKIDEYRIDLRLQCPGALIVTCTPPDTEIRVGSSARRPCAEFPIEVPPGEVTVTAFAHGQIVDKAVTVKGLEETTVSFDIKPGAAVPDVTPPKKVEEPPGNPLHLWGAIVGGTGVAVLVGGAVGDLAVLGPKIEDLKTAADTRSADEQTLFDDASSLQTVLLATYATGAVLTITGAVLFFWPDSPAEQPATSRLSPWLSPEGGGMSWTLDF